MIKKLSYSIFFFSLSLFSFGQENAELEQKARFEFGIETGPALTNIRKDSGSDPVLTFTGGIAIQYNLNNHLSLRSGFSYETKGSKESIGFTDGEGNDLGQIDYYSTGHYVTVPFLLRYSSGDNLKYFANIGPYLSYLLNYENRV